MYRRTVMQCSQYRLLLRNKLRLTVSLLLCVALLLVLNECQTDRHNTERFLTVMKTAPQVNNELWTLMRTWKGLVAVSVYTDEKDRVSSQLLRTGDWEAEARISLQELLKCDPLLDFIDVGAGLGVFTLSVAKWGRRVVALEPNYESAKRLFRAVQVSHFDKQVTVLHNAVSDVRLTVRMSVSRHSHYHAFTVPRNTNDSNRIISKDVNMILLDDLIEVTPFRRAAMRIDIGRDEVDAFSSATKLFKFLDIPYVLMWCWSRRDTEGRKAIFDFFTDKGYIPYSDAKFTKPLVTPLARRWPRVVYWMRGHGCGRSEPVHNLESESATKYLAVMTSARVVKQPIWAQIQTLHKGGVDICLYPPGMDVFISASVLDIGTFEGKATNGMEELFLCVADLHLIDIGANIGLYTLIAARWGRQVVAVEPSLDNADRLFWSIRYNGFRQNVVLLRNAVSDTRTTLQLTANPSNRGNTVMRSDANPSMHIRGQDELPLADRVEVGDVKTILMDDLLAVIKFGRALLKIDTEGAEPLVFAHCTELFDSVDIPYVFMEWGWIKDGKQEEAERLYTFFTGRGYKPYSDPGFTSPLHEFHSLWPFDVYWLKGKKCS